MTIVVTGATGNLGGVVVDSLLRRGVPAGEIVAAGRDRDRLAALAGKGVRTATIELGDPASLRAAFEGAERMLLVSGNEIGNRVALHTNAIEAAGDAGVGHVVYTSFPKAATTSILLAAEHRGTEEALAASGLPATVLRNNIYLENYAGRAAEHVASGTILGSAGEGRICSVLRDELAEAAAAVLTTDGHEGAVYELGGEGFTLAELAAAIATRSGRPVEYRDLPVDEFKGVLLGAGLPEAFATILADSDRGAAQGELDVPPDDLQRLLGRPATTMAEAVTAALAGSG
ncbi:MAG: SDR family oxidoreductase [Acidimicrobiia bacterium]